jgi:hypothetical protein
MKRITVCVVQPLSLVLVLLAVPLQFPSQSEGKLKW